MTVRPTPAALLAGAGAGAGAGEGLTHSVGSPEKQTQKSSRSEGRAVSPPMFQGSSGRHKGYLGGQRAKSGRFLREVLVIALLQAIWEGGGSEQLCPGASRRHPKYGVPKVSQSTSSGSSTVGAAKGSTGLPATPFATM